MNTKEPLASASVILLDPHRGQDEPFGLFLLKRRAASKFMPDRFVFPGGRVEAGDGAAPLADATLRVCALRELWEEAGVILAREPEAAASLSPQARAEALARVERGSAALGEALAGLGLRPDLAALKPYARWITPSARAQRFDTMFYLAPMPPGQEAASDRKETSQGLWLGPGRALRENLAGRVELAPPQVRILGELAAHQSLDELWEAAGQADLSPVRPFLWIKGESRVLLLPWDPDYQAREPIQPARPCQAHVCSRLVNEQGRWWPYNTLGL